MPIRGKKSVTRSNLCGQPQPKRRAIQEELRGQVIMGATQFPLRTVAGVDAGFEEDGRVARAAVVVLRFPDLVPIAHAVARHPAPLPYIPGLLSFREAPAILAALEQLETPPDLLICDGQGIAHPRRFGIASHLGILTGIPSIGCAKTLLIGEHAAVPDVRGGRVLLVDRGEAVGMVLRTRPRVKPVYISPGHRVGIEQAADLVLACTTRYRLPETTRYAHNLASHGTIPT
ncbi:deoxyribonuclease V [Candidatus Oscillochloris fontis]|uniref:deoxyribonuclease V n=1 Tax=Candidatus Oscillochloris fontis TaxID=2496868 RepID=UPI00101C8204|nr:deoxyribonuclease V [Candidatus Oscillochloris fontis]